MNAHSQPNFTFSLVTEPFIRCVMADGSPAEFGLRDVILRAADIAEINDDSPLVMLALHRLLLAILHRSLSGPETNKDRVDLFKAGRFDATAINAYLDQWAERFDLFHGSHPFYQAVGFKTKEPSGINRLAQELSRGNNAALFDHTVDDPPPALSPAQAARVVIAEQSFAVGGGKSDTGNTTHGPIVSGAVVLACGRSLFETLCMNLTIYNDTDPIPSGPEDAPIWERDPVRPDQQSPTESGYLDYLTWQSRTLKLHPEEIDGVTVVRRVSYAQGRRFESRSYFMDPMIAYKKDKDGLKTVRFSEYRELWRDGAALFQFAPGKQLHGPKTLRSLGQVLEQIPESILSRAQARFRLNIFGLCTNKAKVLYWRHETLPLRLRYLEMPLLVDALQAALTLAESCSDALRKAVWAAVSRYLTKLDDESPKDERASAPDKERIQAIVDSLQSNRLYWSRLEPEFRRLVEDLADRDESADVEVLRWLESVLDPAARRAFEDTLASFDKSRGLRAITIGRSRLEVRLWQIKTERQDTTPNGEDA